MIGAEDILWDHSLLGLIWNPRNDTLRIQGPKDYDEWQNLAYITKRILLSIVSSIYDHLGLIAPVTLSLRRCLQDA